MKRRMITIVLAACVAGALTASALASSSDEGWLLTQGSKVTYSDVLDTDWFYQYVSGLGTSGIISGYPDGTFRPYDAVTSGEALKLILLAAGQEEQQSGGGNWADGYLSLALSEGLLDSEDITDLDAPINRLLIAKIAAKALHLSASQTNTPFSDTDDEHVLALYSKGIVEGSYENNARVFKPDSSITRSEISAIIWRISNAAEEEAPGGEQPAEEEPAEEAPRQIRYGSRYLDVLQGVPVNTYDTDGFYWEDGRLCYESGDVRAVTGIDVSTYQGTIDWEKVKADGVEFAIIRVGYRGYTAGGLFLDNTFQRNIEGALAAGLDVGVYFFSQAVTAQEAIEEAEFVLSQIKGYDITYPVVFDWETVGDQSARTNGLGVDTLSQCAAAFCRRIEQAGYVPMVYFNTYIGYLKYDLSQFADYDFWLAQYVDTPAFYYGFQIWQYTSKGSVDGISGNVDVNLSFRRYGD